ncbi:MAG TPA: ATP-binding cassette domain-containing protein, partial [Gammaproteobacteria bacterium]|nr:ATP-binding cassette domain-containing protein [Gammaproteobacteria bacterium]
DRESSVIDNIADGRQFIEIDNQQRHVISYLQDFLFAPDRCRSPVSTLSGGERNRLLLAKLFSKPSNLLVLDEPTNDLDIDTLDLLEELLADYTGTVLLVSHDRSFLDSVATSTLVFEGDGRVNEYVGGYTDWLRQRNPVKPKQSAADKDTLRKPEKSGARPARLGYKDQRELDLLPGQIETLEAEIETFHSHMSDPAFYQLTGDAIADARKQLSGKESELRAAYRRWEQLESKKPA